MYACIRVLLLVASCSMAERKRVTRSTVCWDKMTYCPVLHEYEEPHDYLEVNQMGARQHRHDWFSYGDGWRAQCRHIKWMCARCMQVTCQSTLNEHVMNGKRNGDCADSNKVLAAPAKVCCCHLPLPCIVPTSRVRAGNSERRLRHRC